MGLEAHTTRQLAFLGSDRAVRFQSNSWNNPKGRTVNEIPSTPGRGTSHRPPPAPRSSPLPPPFAAGRSAARVRGRGSSAARPVPGGDASGAAACRAPGRCPARRLSALATAATRDGRALRGPRSGSICFLRRRRRLLLWRLEAGRVEDVPYVKGSGPAAGDGEEESGRAVRLGISLPGGGRQTTGPVVDSSSCLARGERHVRWRQPAVVVAPRFSSGAHHEPRAHGDRASARLRPLKSRRS
ncbi:hypothetical protein PVAP13_3KG480001 [Panicum virgatum]|uniref:Uncharacterized protein n=1 Tax=Panicum virgatum TaxID=38727 RepID=A0A8T0VBS0_PANVG|nr:hypothetical protein PVAP13_3KG480001 [Panicum virgatum]